MSLPIAETLAQLRRPAASAPSPLRLTPADVTGPPPPPDEIELLPGHVEYALHQARSAKWGTLYRAYISWRALNTDLVQDPETDTWHNIPRENSVPPPELPDRDQVLLTTAETDAALATMQQRVWGELQAAWVSAQRQAAEKAARELPKTPWDAGALGQWAWRNGQQLMARRMPPLPFTLTEYGSHLFDLLVYYFAGDEAEFLRQGEQMGLSGLSIHKSLGIFGPVGVGKTSLLKTFAGNPIRPFLMKTAEEVEMAYRKGEEGRKLQRDLCGADGRHLCIDDVCTEEAIVKDFGNPDAPMAKVILGRTRRYEDGTLPRWATHLSSNNPLYRTDEVPADMPTWEERYGERAVNRLEELVNIIPFPGESRRR